jgi:DNA-binding CsgD family transcriptional regulator
MNAVITGDIVNSTLMPKKMFAALIDGLSGLFANDKIEIYRGDSFQAFMKDADDALENCIKSRLLAIQYSDEHRVDIRLSIGLGFIKGDVAHLGSNMEELFVKSGRYFDRFQNSTRKLIIVSGNEDKDLTFEIIAEYMDSILERTTPRQAEILFNLLSGKSQVETARLLNKTKATVSQHVKTARYDEILNLLQKFKILTNRLQHG